MSTDRPTDRDLASPTSEPVSAARWIVMGAIVLVLSIMAVFLAPLVLKVEPDQQVEGLLFPVQEKKPTGPPGKTVLDAEPSFDFGTMAQQVHGKHSWKVTNAGTGNLDLFMGESTCSCTIANFKNKKDAFTLKPGESTDIELAWETRTFKDDFERYATIKVVNDPDRTEIKFQIKGNIQPAISITPENRVLDFGRVRNDTTQLARAALASPDRSDFKILSVTPIRQGLVTTNVIPLTDKDRKDLGLAKLKGGYRIDVELQPSKDLGVFNDELIVATDHPLVPEVRFTLAGHRVGPISVTPETARAAGISPDDGGSTTVMITVQDAPGTTISVLEVPEPLKVEVVPTDLKNGSTAKVRQYRMTVTVPPGTPAGSITGLILLKSDHPHADRIRVPVDIAVYGGK